MRVVDIIQKKRDGLPLDNAEIDYIISGATAGTIPDYQIAALLMAILLRGMTPQETAWLTTAMVESGVRVDLSDISGAKVDKHSTGGVGDKTSLILAPLAAACGVIVPMMSGRGLGHTGGTLDKLESIPGFRIDLTLEEFRSALCDVGCCLIGQTRQIAPADKKLYALRDVTATVESIPLISASIMSKKIAEGIDALVLDVKAGRGAFMKSEADARRLAESLVSIGNKAGVRTHAMLTRMDTPLGKAVGNALEVVECIEILKGRGAIELGDLSVALAARMVVLAELAPSLEAAEERVRKALSSGAGLEKFRQIVARQGGDPRVIDDYGRLPAAPERRVLTAERSGYLSGLDAELIGRATLHLGAGRDSVEDVVDPGVGAMILAERGQRIMAGDPMVELHYRNQSRLAEAVELASRAIEISDTAPSSKSLVIGEVH